MRTSAVGPARVYNAMHQHTVTPLGSFSVPEARFDHVHLDIVGPFPTCKGYSYLLTCVDRFTRWPEAILLVDTTASTIAHAFISGWMARYGTPSTITTDHGAQFKSESSSCAHSEPLESESRCITLPPMALSNAYIVSSKLA